MQDADTVCVNRRIPLQQTECSHTDLTRGKKLMFVTSVSVAVRKGMMSLFLNSSAEGMREKTCSAVVHHIYLWQEVGTCRLGEIPLGLSQKLLAPTDL